MLSSTIIALVGLSNLGAPDASARHPVVFHLITSSEETRDTYGAAIFSAANTALRALTTLELKKPAERGVDKAELDECSGATRLTCLVQHTVSRSKPAYLLVVTVHEGEEGKADLFVLLVDIEHAARFLGAPNENSETETKIFERASVQAIEPVRIADRTDSLGLFMNLFRVYFAERFKISDHAFPNGRILIDTDVADVAVIIDGRQVATTSKTPVLLDLIPAGARELTFHDEQKRVEHDPVSVRIVAGEELIFTPTFKTPSSPVPFLRGITIAAGVVAILVGVGLIYYGSAADSDDAFVRACPGGSCSAGRDFLSFSDLGSGPNIKIAPLGLSLLVGGGLWAAGPILFEEPGEYPWISVLSGVLIRGLTYGTFVVFD